MQAEGPVAMPSAPVVTSFSSRLRRHRALVGFAAAAVVALGAFVVLHFQPQAPQTVPTREEIADNEADLQTGTLVARLTGAKNCVWQSGNPQPGDALHRGQELDLKEGTAEITFDCGAQVVIDGPAALDVESAWDAVLRHGGLKATVEPQAAGFRVRHSSVEVLDLGTEFSMVADANGDAEVQVLKCYVEVSPLGGEEIVPAVLHENESRQFGKGRKNKHNDFAKLHAKLARAQQLDRWKPDAKFCHWSFDEIADNGFKAQSVGFPGSHNVFLEKGGSAVTQAEGRWQKALRLDGQTALTAPLQGLSHAGSRTVAFWVRVPEDAQLSDSLPMIAWQMQSKKLGSRVLEIGWNRNPNRGPLGALHTELGRIYAVGATPLRDGRWHHIAVVFLPIGSSEDAPVQVTQYVDGRLEGTTLKAIKNKRGTNEAASYDVLWLGRAPGKHNKTQYFRGELDELFVLDRALSPAEIVRLMTQNLPPRQEVADAAPALKLEKNLIALTP
jgi:hypothetical protein